MKKCKRCISAIIVCVFWVLSCNVNGFGTEINKNNDLLKDSIVLHIGESDAYVYNEHQQLDEADSSIVPVSENGMVYVPMEFFEKILWTEVAYGAKTGAVFLDYNGNTYTIRKDSRIATTDADSFDIEQPPIIKNNRVYLPVSIADRMMNKDVFYGDSGLVVICEDDLDGISAESINELSELFKKDVAKSGDIEFFVSPSGNDENEGSKEKPFKTILKAKNTVRELIKEGKMESDIKVFLRGGTYHLDETLLFTEEDSGTGFHKVIYSAYENEKPVITGSSEINNWEVYSGDIVKAYVGNRDSIDTLYENGQTLVKARHPNASKDTREWWNFVEAEYAAANYGAFIYKDGDVPYMENINDLEIYLFGGGPIMWRQDRLKVKGIDFDSNFLKLNKNANYPLNVGSQYFIQGALELLDAPGEFYHDTKAGILYYYPTDGKLGGKKVEAPEIKNIIEIRGSNEHSTVKNIEFSGLEIKNNDRFTQLTIMVRENGDAFKISYAENIKISDCHIHDVGSTAIRIEKCAINCKIIGNKIENTGHDGILITGEQFKPTCRNNVICNNYLYRNGMLGGDGRGIFVYTYSAKNNFIVHNRIDRTSGHNIRVASSHWRNYVMYNDLSEANLTQEDTSQIYCDMQGEGAFISNNYLHDSYSRFNGTSGIYFDEGTHNCVAQNNIVTRQDSIGGATVGGAIFFKGPNMTVRNNFSVNNPDVSSAGLIIGKGSGMFKRPTDLKIEKNIIADSGLAPFQFGTFFEKETIGKMDRNLYYNKNNEYKFVNADSFEEWQSLFGANHDKNSLIGVSPQFMGEEKDDYRFRYDAPGYELGINEIETAPMGLQKNFKFADSSEPLKRIFIREQGMAKSSATINLLKNGKTAIKTEARSQTGYVLDLSDAVIKYASDNPSVAVVSQSGEITAYNNGIAKITVTAFKNGGEASLDVFVIVGDEIEDIKLTTDSSAVQNGKTVQIKPIIKTKYGQTNSGILQNVRFTSSNESIMTVSDSGVVRANENNEGDATISFEAEFFGKKYTLDYNMTVVNQIPTEISFETGTVFMNEGNSRTIEFDVFDSAGEVIEDVSKFEFKYELKNNSIANISFDGISKINIAGISNGMSELELSLDYAGSEIKSTVNVVVLNDGSGLPNGLKLTNYQAANGSVEFKSEKDFAFISNGDNIYGSADDATFVHRNMSAENVTIECEIGSFDGVYNSNTAVGPMIRVKNEAESYNVQIRVTPEGKVIMTWRNEEKKSSANYQGGIHQLPTRLKLEKSGDLFKGYCMTADGWQLVGEVTVPMSDNYFAGVAGFSNVVNGFVGAQVSDLTFTHK